MELFVSLPRNEVALAKAAAANGANAIKVHMNVEHRASGPGFGSFAEESKAVLEIIGAVDIPVGLMPGAGPEQLPSPAELTQLAKAGLDFVDIYTHHMPLWFIDLPLKLILAFHEFDGLTEPPYYCTHFPWPPESNRNRIYMAEASFMTPEDYGKPFTYADLRRLRIFQEYVDAPMLVPTQKRITPQDAVWLQRSGAGALMIGAVVTGQTAESVGTATAAYRAALDGDKK
jgi:hypothetical protein